MGIARHELEVRISDAIAWGEMNADPARPDACLRSIGLVGSMPVRVRQSLCVGPGMDDDATSACDHIAAVRRRLLEAHHRDTVSAACGGDHTFLLCDRGLSLFCVLAQGATGGYFGDDDAPPWETWICVARMSGCVDADGRVAAEPVKGILCYVPRCFEPLIAIAMREALGGPIFRVQGDPLASLA